MSDALVQSATIQLKAQAGGGFGSVPDAPPPVTGDPVISGITGTFAQGNVLIISGSNFSANRSGQLLYEDFENGVVGDAPSSIIQNTAVGEYYKVSNDHTFSGGKSAKVDYVVNNPEFQPRFSFPESDQLLITAAVRFEKVVEGNDSNGNRQIKMFRAVGGEGVGDIHSRPILDSIWNVRDNGTEVGGGGSPFTTYGSAPVLDEWMTVRMEWGRSAIDQADGYRNVSGYGFHDSGHSSLDGYFRDPYPAAIAGSPVVPRTVATILSSAITQHPDEDRGMGTLFLPMYMRDSMHYRIWVDCVFINDSSESVVFGDNPDLSLCTQSKLVTQPMNSRSGSSIAVQCEEGTLSTGPVYAFAYNKDGSFNTVGYQVRAS